MSESAHKEYFGKIMKVSLHVGKLKNVVEEIKHEVEKYQTE